MNAKRKIELALAIPAMSIGTAFMGLTAHYGLVSQKMYIECTERLAAEESLLSQGLSRTQRITQLWRDHGFSTSVVSDGTIEAELEACRNPDLLSQVSIFVGTNVLDPIINKGNEWFGPEETTFAERSSQTANEIVEDTSEGLSNRWERTKEWSSDSWDNITDGWDNYWNGDEADVAVPETVAPVIIQQQPQTEPEITIQAPTYNESGDLIEPDENWRDRARDTWDGIDWTPWN